MTRCCGLLINILKWLLETDEKRNKKGKNKMDIPIILLLAVLVFLMALGIFVWHKMHTNSQVSLKGDCKDGQKRHFTEDDRQALLLMRELADIINTVEERLR